MPRKLLRDGCIVADDWHYVGESISDAAGSDSLILTVEQWVADKIHWLSAAGRRGVRLQPAHRVEVLAADLARFDLVAVEFSGPGEGRGYSQARLLRERHGFAGELRATGYVKRDQLFFLARCGFNSFELPKDELPAAAAALRTFSAAYQASNDAGLPRRLQNR